MEQVLILVEVTSSKRYGTRTNVVSCSSTYSIQLRVNTLVSHNKEFHRPSEHNSFSWPSHLKRYVPHPSITIHWPAVIFIYLMRNHLQCPNAVALLQIATSGRTGMDRAVYAKQCAESCALLFSIQTTDCKTSFNMQWIYSNSVMHIYNNISRNRRLFGSWFITCAFSFFNFFSPNHVQFLRTWVTL